MAQTASVIIASRHRPAALLRCIASLQQQDHAQFEVIVVTDPASADAVQALNLPLKVVVFDEANLSMARNLGIAQTAGDIVAFIDDDAVAEPTWLTRLVQALAQPGVLAATGFVRGRNGISYQWRGMEVDAAGQDHDLTVPEAGLKRAVTHRLAVKLLGTNMAFRRSALLALGGFDPAFRFYLEDADISLRLVSQSGVTAIVPGAEVQHGFEASARRRADRVPLSLHDIAASTAVFLRRHAGQAALAARKENLILQQQARLDTHQAAGRMTAAEAEALRDSLQAGWAEGLQRDLPDLLPLSPSTTEFTPLPGTGPRKGIVLAGRIWQRRALQTQAVAARGDGKIVTVICLSPTPRAQRHSFASDGIWWQTGGLFGRSDRNAPRFRWIGFARRVAQETARFQRTRPVK